MQAADTRRLAGVYGEITSVDAILRALARDGVMGKLTAADVYSRSLDCQNLGGFDMLERIATLAGSHAPLDRTGHVLDVGCGLGGPGRFLADRFGCQVTGVDLLPARIQAAAALTQMVGLTDRVACRQADATALPFDPAAFDQAWMLDASIHVRDKVALFGEVARVLKPGGLLVLHDQPGPLPPAMRPVARRSPYIAPSLPHVLRLIQGAGFWVVAWQDTTEQVLRSMQARRDALLLRVEKDATAADRRRHARRLLSLNAYVEALEQQGGRTGVLIARRSNP